MSNKSTDEHSFRIQDTTNKPPMAQTVIKTSNRVSTMTGTAESATALIT